MRLKFLTLLILTGLLGLSVSGCEGKPSSIVNFANHYKNIPAAETTTDSQGNFSASQRIAFESADKVQIIGSFFASSRPNSPAILLLHQFQNDRHSFDDFAKRLQVKGFGILAIDGRGFGESVKTTDGRNVAVSRSDDAVKGMKNDVAAAFEFLAKQQNVDPARIGIIGASYGSSLAIIYGAENRAVKSVVLLSPGINYFGNLPTEPAVKNYGNRRF